MSASIHLDRPHAHFTNLDIITGKVVVQLHSETSISAITVKLEGESRTRLAGPKSAQDRSERKKTELEVHKILYKVATVFPDHDVLQHSSPSSSFTLPPGIYEYPFTFKLPFNNSCLDRGSSSFAVSGFRVESHNMDSHVKKTLPPSLSGFPGEAEIRYYVKATVVRPQFYKENMRAITDFPFLPIEPPRTGNPNEETYARRQQEFAPAGALTQQKKGLFKKRSAPLVSSLGEDPSRFSVDARLPNPPILTCNEPIPLRILVKKLSRSSDILFLQLLQVELISYTHIQAHDLDRTEIRSTVMLSLSNMNVPLGTGHDKAGKEYKIDPNLWNHLPLPNTVAPSFETCNIRRTYELEIRVGLSRGKIGGMQPGILVTSLRLKVQVYSGIAPPQALLDAVTAEKGGRRVPGSTRRPREPVNPPPRPFGQVGALPPDTPLESLQESYDDAPPSYQDAMADTLAPLDGPRREYNPPNASEPVTDRKGPVSQGGQGHAVSNISTSAQTGFENPRRFSNSDVSIDLLPTTPGSRASSIPESFVDELQEPNPAEDGPQPQDEHSRGKMNLNQEPPYPQIAASSTSSSSSTPRVQRSFSMGVPTRKPVPTKPGTTGASKT